MASNRVRVRVRVRVEDRLWAGLIVEDAKTVDSGDMEPRMASNGQGGGVWRG